MNDMSDPEISMLIAAIDRAKAINPGGAKLAVQNATKALNRIVLNAESLPPEHHQIELVRKDGRTLCFTGRLMASATFDAAKGQTTIALELWETQEGNWIAVTSSQVRDLPGIASATVIPSSDDREAREDAAMEQWEWHARARSMVRKLGWSLRMDVA